MDIIKIPLYNYELHGDYVEYKKKIHSIIDIPYNIENSFTNYDEFIKINKSIYARESKYNIFFRQLTKYYYKDSVLEDNDIICPCGNNKFYINYGPYEVWGVCTECGKEDSLYSG